MTQQSITPAQMIGELQRAYNLKTQDIVDLLQMNRHSEIQEVLRKFAETKTITLTPKQTQRVHLAFEMHLINESDHVDLGIMRQWLNTGNSLCGGRTPLELLTTRPTSEIISFLNEIAPPRLVK